MVAAALAFAIPAMSAQHEVSAEKSQGKGNNTNPPIVLPQTEAANNNAQRRTDQPPRWHKFVAWPEGITVWAILFTLVAISWQSYETRKSAKAALKSIKLQEIQLRQWVEVDDWKTSAPFTQPTTKEADLTVSFQVFNPTKIPLTLKSIVATAGPIWEPEFRGSMSTSMQYALAPDSGYPIAIKVPMKGEIFLRYERRQLALVVSIDVGFEDLFDIRRDQKFVFTGKCGPMGWCEFTVSHNTHAN
jgi:hypothetical protein